MSSGRRGSNPFDDNIIAGRNNATDPRNGLNPFSSEYYGEADTNIGSRRPTRPLHETTDPHSNDSTMSSSRTRYAYHGKRGGGNPFDEDGEGSNPFDEDGEGSNPISATYDEKKSIYSTKQNQRSRAMNSSNNPFDSLDKNNIYEIQSLVDEEGKIIKALVNTSHYSRRKSNNPFDSEDDNCEEKTNKTAIGGGNDSIPFDPTNRTRPSFRNDRKNKENPERQANSAPLGRSRNPFDEITEEDSLGNNNTRRPGTPTTAPKEAATPVPSLLPAAKSFASSNESLDFDADFSRLQARNERARAAKELAKDQAEKPIVLRMDNHGRPTSKIREKEFFGNRSSYSPSAVAGRHTKIDPDRSKIASNLFCFGNKQQRYSKLVAPFTSCTSNSNGVNGGAGSAGNHELEERNARNNPSRFSLNNRSGSVSVAGEQSDKGHHRNNVRVRYSAPVSSGNQQMPTPSYHHQGSSPFLVGDRKMSPAPSIDITDTDSVDKNSNFKEDKSPAPPIDITDTDSVDKNSNFEEDKKQSEDSQKSLMPETSTMRSIDGNCEDFHESGEQVEVVESDESDSGSFPPVPGHPPVPPDISSSIRDLHLVEFASEASSRAADNVSQWLFDAGLIDDFLVYGGITDAWGPIGDENRSVQSQEGVEVGEYGNPIEGSNRIDTEIDKLRNLIKRQLDFYNTSLNAGVRPTENEIKELRAGLAIDKDDALLRKLSTYVLNDKSVGQSQQIILKKFPKLKQATIAKDNLIRCFKELDFFVQIPFTCDRLREKLSSCARTPKEWSSLRSVCCEHAELEFLLLEIEVAMTKRSMDFNVEQRHKINGIEREKSAWGNFRGYHKGRSSKFGRETFSDAGLILDSRSKFEMIDLFLEEHTKNVGQLGDEIRSRMISSAPKMFDLAIDNPLGLVALVKAVEAYPNASKEYNVVYGNEVESRSPKLKFTDMRAIVLRELCQDFENRGFRIFNELAAEAADIAEEDEASNKQFNAVIKAANELTKGIVSVKEHMAPCCPSTWAIETLWTTSVAHLCSNNILQQIGGSDGHKLSVLTVTQLLKLVAWVETFRDAIRETFPNIGNVHSQKTYFGQTPKLLGNDDSSVNVDVAKDSIAWVDDTLWGVHDLAKNEFLFRTKTQTKEWLDNVYLGEHKKSQNSEGRLLTSLCEDLYSLVDIQLSTIREHVSSSSEAHVQAVGVILNNLYEKQMANRESFCTDLEMCCAASNDFVRMIEQCERVVAEVQEESNLSLPSKEVLEEQSAALITLYNIDAIYAAQKTHIYCFEPIADAIGEQLFEQAWLDDFTHNELALTLVRTLEDFMQDLEMFVDDIMVHKIIEALVASSVNFYITCLLVTSSKHLSDRKSYFSDNARAIGRMGGDNEVMREYFDGLAQRSKKLSHTVEKEFAILEAVLKLLSIAAGVSQDNCNNMQDFIFVLQKGIGNFQLTKRVVGDLYHLVNPKQEQSIHDLMDNLEEPLKAILPLDERPQGVVRLERSSVPDLTLSQSLAEMYEQRRNPRLTQALKSVAPKHLTSTLEKVEKKVDEVEKKATKTIKRVTDEVEKVELRASLTIKKVTGEVEKTAKKVTDQVEKKAKKATKTLKKVTPKLATKVGKRARNNWQGVL